MKKRWFVIPVVAGLLTLVATGGAILAHGGGHGYGGGKGVEEITGRVAEILELEHVVVQDAFNQAIREKQDARMEAMLENQVSNERITQEEANEILAWFQSRPDVALYLYGIMFRNSESVERLLAHLVEAERITQAEADEVWEWHQDKPDSLPERDGRRGHRGKMFDRDSRPSDARSFDRSTRGQDFRGLTPQISSNEVVFQ